MLCTKYDIEHFVIESSPHIKNVHVTTDEHGDIYVNIELYFWYGLFFSQSYYKYIMGKFEDNLIMGIDCYITIE